MTADFAMDVKSAARRRTLKWGRHGSGVLAAWVAEMDVALAPEITAALHDAIARGQTGYQVRDRLTGLPAACSAWLADTFGWHVSPEGIFLVPDTLTGIDVGIRFYSRPASPVVVPTPAYPPLFEVVESARRPLECVPMVSGPGGPCIDLDAVDAALAPHGGTVLLCQPHNPTGVAASRAELIALSEVVERRGGRVVSDEVHAPLVYPWRTHVPYATVTPEAAAHSITVVSASKTWNVAGLKCSQVVLTNDADVVTWRRIPFHSRHGASALGIVAGLAAYRDGERWRRSVLDRLAANRAFLAEAVPARLPGVTWRPPDATYLAWLDCRALGLDDPAGHFLRESGVALSDGRAFGTPGEGFVRLNFATSEVLLDRIVTALAAALPVPSTARPMGGTP